MKPIIGICANHTPEDFPGVKSGLGLAGQDWQLLASDYVRAIERVGGCPVILPIVNELPSLLSVLNVLDGILFTGGSDIDPMYYGELPQYALGHINPVRDKHEIALCKHVLNKMRIPVLGICRGLQLLNVTAGGTLYQDLKEDNVGTFNHTLLNYPKYYPTHAVNIKDGSKLHRIFESTRIVTNGFNHQAVKDIAEGFLITMEAEDRVVEGIEYDGERFIVAVQWHPEMMLDRSDEFLILFRKFVEQCQKEGPK